MSSDGVFGRNPQTLAGNTDGSTFAAKARAAELKASRTKQATEAPIKEKTDEESHGPAPAPYSATSLDLLVVVKPRQTQVRSSKTLSLSEQTPNFTVTDENTHPTSIPPSTAHSSFPTCQGRSSCDRGAETVASSASATQTASQHGPSMHIHPLSSHGASSTPLYRQRLGPIQGDTTVTALTSRRRPTPDSIVPFPPLIPLDFHSSGLSQPQSPASPTPVSHFDRDRWASISSADTNVLPIDAMPRHSYKPGTPASTSGNSRHLSSASSSGNTKKRDMFHDHPPTGPRVSLNSLNPNSQSPQPRTTPQHSTRGTLSGWTPTSQKNSGSRRSATKQRMEDPFQDHPGRPVQHTNWRDPLNKHIPQPYDYHQNVPVGYFQQFPDQARHYQPPGHNHTMPSPQILARPESLADLRHSSHAESTTYHQPGHEQTPSTQQNRRTSQSLVPQQTVSSYQQVSNIRPSLRMPPPSVKGTPSYDHRLNLLHNKFNEEQLQLFYNSDIEDQEAILEQNFGPQSDLDAPQSSGSLAVGRSQSFNTHAGEQKTAAPTSQLRDPSPYTGFGSKQDMMLHNIKKVVEDSKIQNDISGSSRTVLHDPVAHTRASSSETPGSTITTPNVKGPNSSLQQANLQLLTANKAVAQAMDMNKSNNLGSAPPNGHHAASSEPTAMTGSSHTATTHSHLAQEMTAESRNCIAKLGPAPLSHQSELSSRVSQKPEEASAQSFGRVSQGRLELPQFFPNCLLMRFTATGEPIPHGGFADFITPYNTDFIGTPKDFTPSNDTSQACGNLFLRAVMQDATPPNSNSLEKGVKWFHSADRFYGIHAVAKDLASRAATNGSADNLTARRSSQPTIQSPTANDMPKPIGHERATRSISKESPVLITTSKKNMMKNPTAADAEDLMSGVIANLRLYADGTVLGDQFTRWGRPGEYAIDRSVNGNLSFYGGGWETAPQRVARDPRYQQTVTSDGRATYFEDPGRAKARQWAI